ncbi:hypothetical protein LTR36_005767 [Oleoguttula mirabilis]|uniref:DNA-directed RNA polymerase III subunit RPC9 n=1 Tax=Oleoguttula mirabilis TaxID=1507867 RepID=A0AAV9JEL7_9PEZI|nr:hypothetical protein LTR36_005767 [Oleoguttula mirabilis]
MLFSFLDIVAERGETGMAPLWVTYVEVFSSTANTIHTRSSALLARTPRLQLSNPTKLLNRDNTNINKRQPPKMKVIDAGTEPMSNADVLEFFRNTKARIKTEDAEDKAMGIKIKPRPANFLKAMEKHQRELESNKYPYKKNPKAYDGYDGMGEFDNLVVQRVILPCSDKYRGKGMNEEEIEATLGKEHEMKQLTETEHLQIHNNAPQCVEMLQPMIENHEERFTPEEMELIVQAIMEVYRKEEMAGQGGTEGAEDGTEGETGLDMGELEQGIRELTPYSARAAVTTSEVADPAALPPDSLVLRLAGPQGPQQTRSNADPLGGKQGSEE